MKSLRDRHDPAVRLALAEKAIARLQKRDRDDGINFATDPQEGDWLLVHTTGGHTPSGGLTLAGLTPTGAGMVLATTDGDLWIGTTDTSLLKLAASGGITLDGGDEINGAATAVHFGSGPDGFLSLDADGAALTQQGSGGRPTRVLLRSFDDTESEVLLWAAPNLNAPAALSTGTEVAVHLYPGTSLFSTPGIRMSMPSSGMLEIIDGASGNPVFRVDLSDGSIHTKSGVTALTDDLP